MLAGGEVAEREAERLHVVARAPVGAAEVGRGHALLEGVAAVDVGGGPEAAGRVQPAVGAAVGAPGRPGLQGVAVEEDDVFLLGEFVAARVAAVAGGQEVEGGACGGGVEGERNGQRAVGKCRKGPLVVGELGRVEQRAGALGEGDITRQVALVHGDAGADGVAFVGPGVDVDAHPQGVGIGEPRLHVGEVRGPVDAVGPGAHRFGLVGLGAFGVAEVADAKGGDEAQQLQGWFSRGFPVGFSGVGQDPGEAGGVGVAALLHARQVVAAGSVGKGEQGAALVPGVAGGAQADLHGDGALPVAVGQGDGLQPDAAGVQAVVAAGACDRIRGAARDEVNGVCTPQDDAMVAQGGQAGLLHAAGIQETGQGGEGAKAEGGADHALQLMSAPQHCGDLILPSQEGQRETCTWLPSGRSRWPFSRGTSHLAHWALTDMPHWPQE